MGASPTPSAPEAIRLDEEPVSKTGTGREARGRSSRPASATRRDGREVKTPGSQPGSRGSSPRRGTKPRASVLVAVSTAVVCSRSNVRVRRCRRCQVVERQDVRLLPGRRGFEPLPGSSMPGGRGVQVRGCKPHGDRAVRVRFAPSSCPVAEEFRCVAANHETWVRIPPGRPSQPSNTRGRRPTARMPVRHTGDEGSSPSDHTPGTDQQTTTQERGRPCPRTSTTS